MSDSIDIEAAVRTFMIAVGQSKDVSKHALDLRLALIEEEYEEFDQALRWGDPVQIAKEACDLVYVAVGTLITLGIPFNECFAALQASNMTKIGPNGVAQLREDGKVLKGGDFKPAEDMIKEILGS
jgi:predicted HAD superfamily Cof-like phosphohydrolase